MARFRATIQGQRGNASRLGSAASGMNASVNGWNGGVRIQASANGAGSDQFDIFATSGSNDYNPSRYLGYVDDGGIFVASPELKKAILAGGNW